MGLKPVDSLVYLYYQCSKCGTKSDDVCLADAQSPYFSLRCHHCGNCDEIEQVGQVKLGFVTTTRPWVREEIERTEKKSDTAKQVRKLLIESGYGVRESDAAIEAAMKRCGKLTTVDKLFKRAVQEHEQATA